jgi:hypothetical protein
VQLCPATLRTTQQITSHRHGNLVVLGERVDRVDLLLRRDGSLDLGADPASGVVDSPARRTPLCGADQPASVMLPTGTS